MGRRTGGWRAGWGGIDLLIGARVQVQGGPVWFLPTDGLVFEESFRLLFRVLDPVSKL